MNISFDSLKPNRKDLLMAATIFLRLASFNGFEPSDCSVPYIAGRVHSPLAGNGEAAQLARGGASLHASDAMNGILSSYPTGEAHDPSRGHGRSKIPA
jgi:hypothetical protein